MGNMVVPSERGVPIKLHFSPEPIPVVMVSKHLQCVPVLSIHVYMCIYVFMFIYNYIYKYPYIYMYIYICMYIYIYVYMNMYI